MKTIKAIMGLLTVLLATFVIIFLGCMFNPTFREKYIAGINNNVRNVNAAVEDLIDTDLPYWQWDTDGNVVMIK